MKNTVKTIFRNVSRQRTRQIIAQRLIVISSVFFLIAFGVALLFFNLSEQRESKASTSETLNTGSFIINMGITPQTMANAMKPYGLVHDMITNYSVPVKWIIEPTKVKDGTDFTYNSVAYKGGPFIIPVEYINSTVMSRIAYWQGLGVQGVYTTGSITVPVYTTITSFPLILIDSLSSNQSIIKTYFTNAGIDSTHYDVGAPASLSACHDMWVNPHGDPTWATHSYLYNFVTVQKSYIWSQCHAVSNLEGCRNTSSPYQQLNYLTTNGLKCWKTTGTGAAYCGPTITETHTKNASSPYTYYYPTSPVMQFMSTIYSPTATGSEQWYQPQSTGGWRTTTNRVVTTGTGTSPKEGVLMVYGPAYGDSTNGWVMYTAGHDLNAGTVTENISAQRAFLNFALLAGKAKQLLFSSSSIPVSLTGASQPVSVTVTSGMAPYSYQWSTNLGGSFTDPTSASTYYNPPLVSEVTQGYITCVVTDACGRRNFITQLITVNPSPLPVTFLYFKADETEKNKVTLSWTTGAEINNEYFSVERSQDGASFSRLGKVPGSGNSTDVLHYDFVDHAPLAGISYYRLSQTDFDGTTVSHATISIRREHVAIKLKVYFNTDENSVSGYYNLERDEKVTIRIFNSGGKLIDETEQAGKKGMNAISILLTRQLGRGIYYLTLLPKDKKAEACRFIIR